MFETLKHLADIFWNPIPEEARNNLKMAWDQLDPEMHHPRQMYGTHGHNCGALIGAMPRCDFACQGCYLGEEANQIPPLPMEEIKKQMRQLRPFLGPVGNLQLTDGEITLRPEAELVEMVRYARSIGHLPMLMTHGDTFRRRPGLLERLMEAGLNEVSIHVDTEMRGRKGDAYRKAKREEELHALRDEFTEIIRQARKRTGLRISAATTMTVMPQNLEGVAPVMRWLLKNADVFKLVSFQPAAQVGRTLDGLGGGVSAEDVWDQIFEALYGGTDTPREYLGNATFWMGHKDCNRSCLGSVLTRPGREPRFEPMFHFDQEEDVDFSLALRRDFGGSNFRADTRPEALARLLGCFREHPRTMLSILGQARRVFSRHAPGELLQVAKELLSGEATVRGFHIASHHFMSRAEIETAKGQERLKHCIFKLPIGDRLVSMCETNAMGVREAFYQEIAEKFPKRPAQPAATPIPAE